MRAETLQYTIRIPDRQRVAYEIALPVRNPGPLSVDASWTGGRILAFRLESGPGAALRVRRSGPSPQRIEAEVGATAAASGAVWALSIHGLPAAGEGEGVLTIRLPDPPEEVVRREEAMRPPPPPPPAPDPWTLAREAPPGAAPDRVLLFERVEEFRALVVRSDGRMIPDPCRWNEDVLRYLAHWRDRSAAGIGIPAVSTSRFFRRLAEAARRIEALRTSKDPILAGPPPDESGRRRAWQTLREQPMRELERELDQLLEMVRNGFAPELEGLEWPTRLVSCMMACERYFDERVTLGESGALNAGIAKSQWPAALAAARALETLSTMSAPLQ